MKGAGQHVKLGHETFGAGRESGVQIDFTDPGYPDRVYRGIRRADAASENNTEVEEPSGALETQILASRCLVDLYCEVFDVVRPELSQVITIVVDFIKSPYQQAATAGVAQLQRLTENLGGELNGSE